MNCEKIPFGTQMELSRMAKELRAELGLSNDVPVGNDLRVMLQKLSIVLLEWPIPRVGSNSFSAVYLQSQTADCPMAFIGVNTQDYYDRQIFAIAHELYHHKQHTPPHISRLDSEHNLTEQQADWFAAELLLPLLVVREQIYSDFGKSEISDIPLHTLLRFIARLHCTWWLPYKSIVHRLYEADAINEEVFSSLYHVDERAPSALYFRIGVNISPFVFTFLNTVTKRTGTDSSNLECCLRNYEEAIISEEELFDGLALFQMKPADFGISFISEPDGFGGEGDEG